MSWIEWLAAACGVVCVALLARRSLWNYPFALASVGLLGWVFWRERLYSDAVLQGFFLLINLYGWWRWAGASAAAGEVRVERLDAHARAGWAAATAAATLAWGWSMARWTDAAYPWWDAAVAVPSVAAQALLARRFLENWWVWIAADMVAVPLYLAKQLWAAAGLYLVYLALSAWALAGWRRLAPPRAAGPAGAGA